MLTTLGCTNEEWYSNYQTICIATDGEAKCGDALVQLIMKKPLDSTLPLYPLLLKLKFFNNLIGSDNLTVDKNFKHVFKCQWNLLMHAKWLQIKGFALLPQSFRGNCNPIEYQYCIFGYCWIQITSRILFSYIHYWKRFSYYQISQKSKTQHLYRPKRYSKYTVLSLGTLSCFIY